MTFCPRSNKREGGKEAVREGDRWLATSLSSRRGCVFYECNRHSGQSQIRKSAGGPRDRDQLAMGIVRVRVAQQLQQPWPLPLPLPSQVRVRVGVRVRAESVSELESELESQLPSGSSISMVQLSHIETLIASRLLGSWRPKPVIVLFHSWTPQLPKALPPSLPSPALFLSPPPLAWLSRPLQLATLATAFAMITFGGCWLRQPHNSALPLTLPPPSFSKPPCNAPLLYVRHAVCGQWLQLRKINADSAGCSKMQMHQRSQPRTWARTRRRTRRRSRRRSMHTSRVAS